MLALGPFLLSGLLISGYEYKDLWRTEKHLDLATGAILGAIAACFIAGSLVHTLFAKKATPQESDIDYGRLERLFLLTYVATVSGYLFWAAVCFTHGVGPAEVLAILRGDAGASYTIRDLGTTIPGMTTATQFGMAAAILGAILWTRRRSLYVGALLLLLIFMSLVRALLWSERLALIEVAIPLLISAFGRRDWSGHPRMRRLIYIAPVAGCVFLYLYFTAFESVRSWGHYSEAGGSLWYFSWMRLGGYYITALNNGALMYKTIGTLPFPYTVFESFWKFPGMSLVLPYNDVFSVDPYAYLDSLKAMANPEFNNPSGIFPYVLDFSPIGACVFFFAAGWLATATYAAFRRDRIAGLLCYPLLYISLLEISRIPYLTASRTLPSWIILFIGIQLIKKRPARWRASMRRGRDEPRNPRGVMQYHLPVIRPFSGPATYNEKH